MRVPPLLACFVATCNFAAPALGADAHIQEDTGQVAINSPSEGQLGAGGVISATVFRGVPGPKTCRGPPMAELPIGRGATAAEHCFDLPAPAGCAIFVAAKDDGCEARLFAEPGCTSYVNTAVFMPEARAVGGSFRSIGLRCGIPAPDPDSLGTPPLAGLIKPH